MSEDPIDVAAPASSNDPVDEACTPANENDNKGSKRNRSRSQDTKDTHMDVSVSDSSDDGHMEECVDDVSDHDFDGDARFSSKSLVSLSSKASSSTKPVSSKSVSSHPSSYSSSSDSRDENGPTADEMKRLQAQLQKSLQEEKRLLTIQQQLLFQMEEIEHAIVKAEHEERVARVAAQQAHISNLLDRAIDVDGT